MNTFTKCLVVCAAIGLPVAASWAQSSDATYCKALADKYQKYVGDNQAMHKGQARDAKMDSAVAGCPTNAASSIPTLEKALTDAKVDLPARN